MLPCALSTADPGQTLYVVDHGWHTDLVLPATALRGSLHSFRDRFPGMRFLLMGFGRRTFMTAPVTDLADLLIGPLPGRGALLVAALSAPPDQAYSDGTEARLPLDEPAAHRLSDFLWRSFRLHDDAPSVIAPGFFPGSLFFDATPGYSGLYTCNGWTADALHAAGLSPSAPLFAALFSSQIMRRLRAQNAPLCRIGSS